MPAAAALPTAPRCSLGSGTAASSGNANRGTAASSGTAACSVVPQSPGALLLCCGGGSIS